jgi:ABC-type uncharacterized transport system ATPase subunit
MSERILAGMNDDERNQLSKMLTVVKENLVIIKNESDIED